MSEYVWVVYQHRWDFTDNHWVRDVYKIFKFKKDAIMCARKKFNKFYGRRKMRFIGKRKLY